MRRYKLREGTKTKQIFDTIKEAKKPISINEIRSSTGINYNTVRGAINRLIKQGLIKRVKKGVYRVLEE